jgi:hypothetical protein
MCISSPNRDGHLTHLNASAYHFCLAFAPGGFREAAYRLEVQSPETEIDGQEKAGII